MRNPHKVISRTLALERVWGDESAATLNAVDRYVSGGTISPSRRRSESQPQGMDDTERRRAERAVLRLLAEEPQPAAA